MNKNCYILASLIAALSGLAYAGDTVRFGSKVVSVGDSTGKVMQAAGNPDRIVQLQNKYGAGVGERFEYYRDGKTTMITISGGKVISIEEQR